MQTYCSDSVPLCLPLKFTHYFFVKMRCKFPFALLFIMPLV